MIHFHDKGPNFIFLYNMYVPCAAVSAARADPGRITTLLKVVCPLPCRFSLIFIKGSKSPVKVTTEIVGCWWVLSAMTTKNSEVGISSQDDHSIKHCCSYMVGGGIKFLYDCWQLSNCSNNLHKKFLDNLIMMHSKTT